MNAPSPCLKAETVEKGCCQMCSPTCGQLSSCDKVGRSCLSHWGNKSHHHPHLSLSYGLLAAAFSACSQPCINREVLSGKNLCPSPWTCLPESLISSSSWHQWSMISALSRHWLFQHKHCPGALIRPRVGVGRLQKAWNSLPCMTNVANPLMRGTAAWGGQRLKEALTAEVPGMLYTNKPAGVMQTLPPSPSLLETRANYRQSTILRKKTFPFVSLGLWQ